MPPTWLFYARVKDLEAAIAAITTHGGKVLNGPHQVPGGDHVLQAMDPQGGHFALHHSAT